MTPNRTFRGGERFPPTTVDSGFLLQGLTLRTRACRVGETHRPGRQTLVSTASCGRSYGPGPAFEQPRKLTRAIERATDEAFTVDKPEELLVPVAKY